MWAHDLPGMSPHHPPWTWDRPQKNPPTRQGQPPSAARENQVAQGRRQCARWNRSRPRWDPELPCARWNPPPPRSGLMFSRCRENPPRSHSAQEPPCARQDQPRPHSRLEPSCAHQDSPRPHSAQELRRVRQSSPPPRSGLELLRSPGRPGLAPPLSWPRSDWVHRAHRVLYRVWALQATAPSWWPRRPSRTMQPLGDRDAVLHREPRRSPMLVMRLATRQALPPGRWSCPCATGLNPVGPSPRLGQLEMRLGPAWVRYRETATPETDPPSAFHRPVLILERHRARSSRLRVTLPRCRPSPWCPPAAMPTSPTYPARVRLRLRGPQVAAAVAVPGRRGACSEIHPSVLPAPAVLHRVAD